MARYFNADYLTFADHPALSLGDNVDNSGPFSLSFWFRKGTMADVDVHYLMSWGLWQGNPSANILIFGDNHATQAGLIRVQFEDVPGRLLLLLFNDAITDAVWHHVAIVFDGATLRAWLDDSLQSNTATQPRLNMIDVPSNWYFGQYSDGGDLFIGDMAEWAKWDVELTVGVIAALAAGASPLHFPEARAWYWPGKTHLREVDAGITITNNGTTLSIHPLVADPLIPVAISPVVQPVIAS